jgi:hypothetical protein
VTEKTVVRTGYGISFYPRRMGQFNFPILQNNGFPSANAFVPGGGDDDDGISGVFAVQSAFERGD